MARSQDLGSSPHGRSTQSSGVRGGTMSSAPAPPEPPPPESHLSQTWSSPPLGRCPALCGHIALRGSRSACQRSCLESVRWASARHALTCMQVSACAGLRTWVPSNVKLWREPGAPVYPLPHAHLLLCRRLKAEVVWEHCLLIASRQPRHNKCHLAHRHKFSQEATVTTLHLSCIIGFDQVLRLVLPITLWSVQCAQYAARSRGLTAVPVNHGIAAVLTIATCLHRAWRAAQSHRLSFNVASL